MERKIGPVFQAPHLTTCRAGAPKDNHVGLTCHDPRAAFHFGIRLLRRERRESWVGHGNGRGLQRPRAPEEELEEADLAGVPRELTETHHGDARDEVFFGGRLFPELECEVVASGFSASFTLQKMVESVRKAYQGSLKLIMVLEK